MEHKKILIVCLGNICRSPLAQGILNAKVNHLNIEVDSAGKSNYHIGYSPDPRIIAVGLKNNIYIRKQIARSFSVNDFKVFAYIYVIDYNNHEDPILLASSIQEQLKVNYILPNQENIPDPFYGGKEGFDQCFSLLENACERIANILKK
ncbi:low molecular weight phosphotyrosine protein phosphatase [Flavobacteriaceae bacterium]|nr:low molecular weight phosphotyrosine protein phosphatase [Flavobacteriaceae bacterium]